ncbi:MAG: GyrI-like domain-containing protein [Rhodospirillaceae bacterium]|nr:GyrI-like domain-containing protein [Rhodospirillaceae bacterium]
MTLPRTGRDQRAAPVWHGVRRGTIDVRIETFQAIHVACVREVGPLSAVGPCFRRLFHWAESVNAPTGRLLTLSFHRKDAEPPQRWYWKAGVELFTRHAPPPGIGLEDVGAGRYAVLRLRGPHEGMAGAYRWLFKEWLPDSAEAVDGRACLEFYRNTPREVAPEQLITDLCVPLRAPTDM